MTNIKEITELPKWAKDKSLKKIISSLNEVNAEVKIVGSAVRSALCKSNDHIEPDIDLVTDLLPEKVMKILINKGMKCIPTGIKHGTITVIYKKLTVEITTLRSDSETDGRHAKVKYLKSWYQDAKRRDLTINTIYMDIDGNLFDPFMGVQDLINGRVRFVGNPENRILEDYLRIFRFIRFHSYYSFSPPDDKALKAIKKHLKKVSLLSRERILDELKKIFSQPASKIEIASKLMKDTNLDIVCFGQKFNLANLRTFNKIDLDVDWLSCLSSLIHVDEKTVKFLPLSRLDRRRYFLINKLIDNSDQKKLLSNKWKQTAYKIGEEVTLRFILSSLENSSIKSRAKEISLFEIPQFFVTGSDLIKLGIKPGEKLGKILKILENKWIEKDFLITKKELLSKVNIENIS